ncbi:hypothetical protein ACIQOV_19285 [Kitasatospora sp. NPDC091257]|uniref:hypothetical protein n=1 Tax=unclassified Kitasatospora TaxID=2633591 RepID=UPI002F91940A
MTTAWFDRIAARLAEPDIQGPLSAAWSLAHQTVFWALAVTTDTGGDTLAACGTHNHAIELRGFLPEPDDGDDPETDLTFADGPRLAEFLEQAERRLSAAAATAATPDEVYTVLVAVRLLGHTAAAVRTTLRPAQTAR